MHREDLLALLDREQRLDIEYPDMEKEVLPHVILRGYRFLTIDAGPMSRPIAEKHGFTFLTYAHACRSKAVGTGAEAAI